MDLQTLSRAATDRSPSDDDAAKRIAPPRRRWLTRIGVPSAIVLATAALLGYAASDWVVPATEVQVTRAVALPGRATPPARDEAAAVVAQAPGWVEPNPYPIYVSALADGVVERIEVLEGETVQAGQTLVRLIGDDARLALAAARAELARREADLAAARTEFDEPVALVRAAAVSRAKLAEAKADLIRLDAEIAREQARFDEFRAAYDRLASLPRESVSLLQLDTTKHRMESQRAVVRATHQRRPGLEALVDAAEAERVAAERDLELKTQRRRDLDEATAAVDAARTAVAEAELRLRRMTIASPIDGVVMQRLVAPGDKVRLGIDGRHTAHVMHLYDPASLQVRVDVPLADAAAVGLGHRAKVVVDVLPDREFEGVVTRVVHLADIAKNTVQFKVAIENPSPLLKPDMLARAKFFGRAEDVARDDAEASAASSGLIVAVDRSTIVATGDGKAFVWWVSPANNRIERRTVTVGPTRTDGVIEIHRGLNPGDVVVAQPDSDLVAGQRVRIAGSGQ